MDRIQERRDAHPPDEFITIHLPRKDWQAVVSCVDFRIAAMTRAKHNGSTVDLLRRLQTVLNRHIRP